MAGIKRQHIPSSAPTSDVRTWEQSNLTTLANATGKVPLNCEHCGAIFLRYACHAKRSAHNYCGKGCAIAASIGPHVEKICAVCGKPFVVAIYEVEKLVTCSEECTKTRKLRLIPLIKAKQLHRVEVIGRLQACLSDPMWADHAEISKATLAAAIALLKKSKSNERLERLKDARNVLPTQKDASQEPSDPAGHEGS